MQKLTLTLGRNFVEISAEKSQDIIRTAAFWQSLPTECPVCDSSVIFDYQTPKTYKYYKLKCTGQTPHSVALSERQDGTGMYFDRGKNWEVWRAGVDEQAAAEQSQASTLPGHNNAPGSPRGEAIARIQSLITQASKANVEIRIDVLNLGSKSDPQLAAIEKHLGGLLAQPATRRAA